MANYLLNASDAALRTLIGHLEDIQMKDFSGSKIIIGLDVFCAFFEPLSIPPRSCSLISRTALNINGTGSGTVLSWKRPFPKWLLPER